MLVDGFPVRSCLMLAVQADQTAVQTIEGISNDNELTPLQKAFRKHHALQCGFCTPGMIMSAIDMVRRLGPKLDDMRSRCSRSIMTMSASFSPSRMEV